MLRFRGEKYKVVGIVLNLRRKERLDINWINVGIVLFFKGCFGMRNLDY